MCHKIVIIGAGGHAKVIADIVVKTGNILIGFLDDNIENGKTILNYKNQSFNVIGKIADSINLLEKDKQIKFVIGIGNNNIRKKIDNEYKLPYITLIHPSASISIATNIGEGTVVMANAVINTNTNIGKHCIINTGAIVEHDNVIEDYVHISPNSSLGGTVHIEELTHIGIGAIVKNNINITSKCIIGAGAVVVKNIEKSSTYVGVPAKDIKIYNINS